MTRAHSEAASALASQTERASTGGPITERQRVELLILSTGVLSALRKWNPDSSAGHETRLGGMAACNAVLNCFRRPIEIDWHSIRDVSRMGLDILNSPDAGELAQHLPDIESVRGLLNLAEQRLAILEPPTAAAY